MTGLSYTKNGMFVVQWPDIEGNQIMIEENQIMIEGNQIMNRGELDNDRRGTR